MSRGYALSVLQESCLGFQNQAYERIRMQSGSRALEVLYAYWPPMTASTGDLYAFVAFAILTTRSMFYGSLSAHTFRSKSVMRWRNLGSPKAILWLSLSKSS